MNTKQIWRIALSVGLLALASCDNDEPKSIEAGGVGPVELKINPIVRGMGGEQSRAYDTTWEDGDIIYVYDVENIYNDTYKFEYNRANGEWTSIGNKYIFDYWINSFFGVYPVDVADYSGGKYELDISDQTTEEKRKGFDIISSDGTFVSTDNDGKADLVFVHRMAKLNLKIKFESSAYQATASTPFVLTGIPCKGSFVYGVNFYADIYRWSSPKFEYDAVDGGSFIRFQADEVSDDGSCTVTLFLIPNEATSVSVMGSIDGYVLTSNDFAENFQSGHEYNYEVTLR